MNTKTSHKDFKRNLVWQKFLDLKFYEVDNKHIRKVTKVKGINVNLMCTIYFLKLVFKFLSCTPTQTPSNYTPRKSI